jgi:hypothetical protein
MMIFGTSVALVVGGERVCGDGRALENSESAAATVAVLPVLATLVFVLGLRGRWGF